MPSLDEGFGIIPIEAGISGIPTITSGRGGLTDSSVKELIVQNNTPKDFVSKIREIEKNPDKYAKLSIENSKRKSSDNVFKKFRQVVNERFNIKL